MEGSQTMRMGAIHLVVTTAVWFNGCTLVWFLLIQKSTTCRYTRPVNTQETSLLPMSTYKVVCECFSLVDVTRPDTDLVTCTK